MKNFFYIFALPLALLFTSCNLDHDIKIIENNLCFCDAFCADNDTLFITNQGGDDPLDVNVSDGYILQIYDHLVTRVSLPANTLYSPKGMLRVGDFLYVADVCRVHAIDLASPVHKTTTVFLPDSEIYASRLELIGDMILLSSTSSNKVLTLQVNQDGSPSSDNFQFYLNIPGADGLLYHKGKLYVSSYNLNGEPNAENVIYVVDDFNISQPQPLISRIGQYRGLAVKDDFLYFSDCNGGIIGKIDLNNPENIEFLELNLENEVKNPSEIEFIDGRLCVSDLQNSRILLIN